MEAGADLVFCTGGMSVDPDDKTPLAIKNTGARIVSYGAPVLPGAMFLLAYAKTEHRSSACGMRHVFETDDFRSCPAAPHCR